MSHRQTKCADKTISGLNTYRLDYNYGMKLPDKTIPMDQIQSAQNNFKNISKPSTHIESIENNESIKRTKCFLTLFHELSAPNCSFGTKNMVCFIEKRMDGSFSLTYVTTRNGYLFD